MNIYVVDAGPYTYTDVIDSELGGPQVEDYAMRIVAAESRGQAKSVFLQYDKDWQRSFEFTKMRVLVLERNTDLDELKVKTPHVMEYEETNQPYLTKWWDEAYKKLGRT